MGSLGRHAGTFLNHRKGCRRRRRLQLAEEMTRGWSPNLRRLIELTDLSTTLSINIRTSVPLDPWETLRK